VTNLDEKVPVGDDLVAVGYSNCICAEKMVSKLEKKYDCPCRLYWILVLSSGSLMPQASQHGGHVPG